MYNYIEISVHEAGQAMLGRRRSKHEGGNFMKSKGRVKIARHI
jgi:hypothetical protein